MKRYSISQTYLIKLLLGALSDSGDKFDLDLILQGQIEQLSKISNFGQMFLRYSQYAAII